MDLDLFGRAGTTVRAEAGDVVVLPAGVSHPMTAASRDILVIGGYPDGRDWDNIREEFLTEALYRAAAKLIMSLPIPAADPVTGQALTAWLEAPSSVDSGWNDFRDGLDATG